MAQFFGPGRDEMLNLTPHARYLGMSVIEVGPGFAVVRLPYRPEFIGDPVRKVVFGGAVTTLLDNTCGLAVVCSLDAVRPVATVDLRVDYLRAAEPERDLYARVECYKVTRNIAFVRGVAYERDLGDPFASCLGTFVLAAKFSPEPYERMVAAAASRGCEEQR